MFRPFYLLLFPALLQAQSFSFVAYSVYEGLPQSQVWALEQDHRGYLWCGTQGGGICRFDGYNFEQFDDRGNSPSPFIQHLFIDGSGRLWMAGNKAIAVFADNVFSSFVLQNDRPLCFAETETGEIYAGAASGIYRYRPLQASFEKVSRRNFLVNALLSSGGELWVGASDGLYRGHEANEAAFCKGKYITAICKGNGEALWAGDISGSLYRIFPRSLEMQKIDGFGQISCLTLAPDGQIWIGTYNDGFYIYHPETGNRVHINESNGLPHNNVRRILFDRNGHTWIATSGGGLVKCLPQQFRHFKTEHGLQNNRIYALAEAAGGRLWVCAGQTGLQWIDSLGIHAFQGDSGRLAGVKIKSLCVDRRQQLWVGTEGRGLALIAGDSTGSTSMIPGLPSPWIQKIVADSKGNIWAATYSEGLVRLNEEGRVQKYYGLREGLPELQIQAMAVDPSGAIWLGFSSGKLASITNEKSIKTYGKESGLPETPVRDLEFDAKGRLWVAGRGGGIYCGEKGVFKEAVPADKLGSQNIYSLIFDRQGDLWAGFENGVQQFKIDGDGSVYKSSFFGRSEGFLGIENCHDAAICDTFGNLWFGTMNGLTMRYPRAADREYRPPSLYIEQIGLFYKPLQQTSYAAWMDREDKLKPGLELPWHQNQFSFSFGAVDLDNPRGIRYRWRLDGAEPDWSPWSNQRQVNYANLQPGAYTFYVQALGAGAQVAELKLETFIVKPPFWQLWRFRLAVFLTAAGVLWYLIRRYVRGVKAREAEKRAQLELRHRMLELERQALQLQMNPHFIFNAFAAIQGLVGQGDTAAAKREIGNFAKLMRGILAHSRRKTISLAEEAETLAQYLEVERFCREAKFEYSVEFSPDIDAEDVEIPPMLLQPFVENAVVHGVAQLPRPGEIKIRFSRENELLVCMVEDNGIGRAAAAKRRQERKPGHVPLAMEITRERLETLKGEAEYDPLQIEDLTDELGRPGGTRVLVRLPE